MSIERKHYYRFTYLKSEHWDSLRLQVLADKKGRCHICGDEKWNNDVHHVIYRNLYDVKLKDLRVLCRGCHQEVHEVIKRNSRITDIAVAGARWHRTMMAIRTKRRSEQPLNQFASWRLAQYRKMLRSTCRRLGVEFWGKYKGFYQFLKRNELFTDNQFLEFAKMEQANVSG